MSKLGKWMASEGRCRTSETNTIREPAAKVKSAQRRRLEKEKQAAALAQTKGKNGYDSPDLSDFENGDTDDDDSMD